MLSIIIPVYSAEKYIQECLNSIVSQNKLNEIEYEIILGIDHCEKSLDKIKEIRNNYGTNLKVIWTEKNAGSYVTVNTLISIAKYDFILKFDADDIVKPNLFETVWKHRNDYDIVRFAYNFYFSESNKDEEVKHCAAGVYLINKKIYEKLGGYQPWKCAADNEFLNRCRRTNVKMLDLTNKHLFYYRQHNNSLTRNEETKMGSRLRNSYHRQYSKNIYIKPLTVAYIEI